MTRRHIALVALVATLLAIAAVFALDRDEAPRPLPAAAQPAAGPRVAATAPGRVEPVGEEREIAAELRGRLLRVHVDEGDTVRAGQILAELAG
jgi:multidrug efflux pump subunit AcrA (membrane-fusion protein)